MNLRSKFILALFFCIGGNHVFGQAEICVRDSSYANIELRIYAYENLLTHKLKKIAQQQANNKGETIFKLPITEPQLLYIPIYSFRLIFYAEPNKTIHLQLPERMQLENEFLKFKSYANREIPLFIKPENSLNQAIANYDRDYNLFLKKNFEKIYNKKNEEQHINKLKDFSAFHSSYYFTSYAAYKEAYLAYVSGKRAELLNSYFSGRSLLLHNTAYVNLLRKLAKEIAMNLTQDIKYKKRFQEFLNAKTYNSLTDVANRMGETKDKAFNEHLLIYVLHSGLQQKLFVRQLALEKLQIITEHSPSEVNRNLAQSIIQQNKKRFKGTAAPPFSLEATDGEKYSESILKAEKPTIIAFFDSSENNQKSVTTLLELQQKHKNNFNIVVFGCENALKEIPKTWKQFTIPFYSYIIRDYHLGRFPYYILIDKNGKIAEQTWQQYLISLEE